MFKLARTAAILLALLLPGSMFTVASAAQCSYTPGAPIQLAGTPHLFIADEQGVLHWGGDTRALAGRVIEWGNQCAVGLDELRRARRGDPWLTAGLPKIGDPIYLAKWEDVDPAPTLLHIQTIADVELFGINESNYGNFVLDRAVWEQRYGFDVGTLQVGPLASAASFAWPESDRAAYGELLTNMKGVLSAALFSAHQAGTDPARVLPSLADCERQGLTEFERGRNGGVSLQTTQGCVSRISPGGPVAAAPASPRNVRVTALGPTQIIVSWDDAPDESGFRIYGGDQITPPSSFVASVPANFASHTVSGLSQGMTYCYSVSAFNPAGESAAAGPACASTSGTPIGPAAPGNFRVLVATSSAIELEWTASTDDEQGFYIYEGSQTVALVGANTTRWTISPWNTAVQHCYEVVAFNAFGQSARSNTACAGPLTGPPPPASPTSTGVPSTLAPTATAPASTPTAPVSTPTPPVLPPTPTTQALP